MRASQRLAAAVAAAAVIVGGTAVAAIGHGYDISWPQCGAALPSDGDFRIVGVSGGKPYEDNPCLAEQYQWALARPVAFYMNTANPGTASRVVNWYGQKSPNPNCSARDEAACAYNYGFNAAKHAFSYAQTKTGAAARWSWWLDVETDNSWSTNTPVNLASLVGSIAYLRSQGVPVGVYSTEYMWNRIAGGARLPDVPNWLAGARNGPQAVRWCTDPTSSFTGGPLILIQWVESDLDHNHACAPLPVSTAPPPSSKTGLDLVLEDLLTLNLPKLLSDLGGGAK